jgi:hypothetical protein
VLCNIVRVLAPALTVPHMLPAATAITRTGALQVIRTLNAQRQRHPSCLSLLWSRRMSARVQTRTRIAQRMRNALTLSAGGMLVTLNTMALPVQSTGDSFPHFGGTAVRLYFC